MLPEFPVDTPLSYLGFVFIIVGFFLILAGVGILKVKSVTVRRGARTVAFGIFFVLLGSGSLLVDAGYIPWIAAKEPRIVVKQPQRILTCPNENSSCTFEISGNVGGVTEFSDLQVYTFVFPLDPKGAGWYLQRPPTTINRNGSWVQAPAYLGTDDIPPSTDDTLRIQAALVGSNASYQGTRLDDLETVAVLTAIEEIDGIVALSDPVDLRVER